MMLNRTAVHRRMRIAWSAVLLLLAPWVKAAEHRLMDEVSNQQGQNHWYYAASQQASGVRTALMSYSANYRNQNTYAAWNYAAGGTRLTIRDGSYPPAGLPAGDYSRTGNEAGHYLMLQCDRAGSGNWIPRVEWESTYPAGTRLVLRGVFQSLSATSNASFCGRILLNGVQVWQSSSLSPRQRAAFDVPLVVNPGDILTLTQHQWIDNSISLWRNVRLDIATTSTAIDPTGIVEPAASLRGHRNLNFNWRFNQNNPTGDPSSRGYTDTSWRTVTVPHNPTFTDGIADPMRNSWPNLYATTAAWYRKHFTLPNGLEQRRILLHFEGVAMVSDVWINDTWLARHQGSYLPFTLDVTDQVLPGGAENVIALKTDNSVTSSVPLGRHFCYPGLYRNVWLDDLPAVHITDPLMAGVPGSGGVCIEYPQVSTASALVEVKTHVANTGSTARNFTVRNLLFDTSGTCVAATSSPATLNTGSSATLVQFLTVNQPNLWSPNSPARYRLYSEVLESEIPIDRVLTHIGIRKLRFSYPDGFYLNDQPLEIRGANRMQEWPSIGYAVPDNAQRLDALLLKEAGFNMVRLAHYPQSAAFLDACDELGLLVVNCLPGFQYFEEGEYRELSYRNMREMLRLDRNRPCIALWEMSLNETDFPTNFAVAAMDLSREEFVGSNVWYCGWKDDQVYDVFIATPTAGARSYTGNRPLLISEHGHFEYEGFEAERASSEADLLQQAANHLDSHNQNRALSNYCGDNVWVGFDQAVWNPGAYDRYRLPKYALDFWQSQRDPALPFTGVNSGPMVAIANRWLSDSPRDVRIYSNCQQISLYVNGNLIATRSPDATASMAHIEHPPFTFPSLSYSAGELKAVGLINGQIVASDVIYTPSVGHHLGLDIVARTADFNTTDNLLIVYGTLLDANNHPLYTNNIRMNFTVTGDAYAVTPLQHRTEGGIGVLFIRTAVPRGTVRIQATTSSYSGSLDFAWGHAPMFRADPFTRPFAIGGRAYADSIANEGIDIDTQDTLTFDKLAGPAWLSVSPAGELTGTPPAEASGTHSFVIRVHDAQGLTAQATLQILVKARTATRSAAWSLE